MTVYLNKDLSSDECQSDSTIQRASGRTKNKREIVKYLV